MAGSATPPQPETIECPGCEAVIGKSEAKCPKCGIDIAEMEDTISAVERANKVLEKRKAKTAPAPAPAPTATKPKGAAKLRAIGGAFRKE